MKCNVIKTDKGIIRNVELTHSECVKLSRLSEVAAVLDLKETPSGMRAIYQDGVLRQYDPVNNEIIGAAQPFKGRNGWTS